MQDKFWKSCWIFITLFTQGYMGSRITYLKSDFQNSWWRTRNGGKILKKLMDSHKTCDSGLFGVADYKSDSDFSCRDIISQDVVPVVKANMRYLKQMRNKRMVSVKSNIFIFNVHLPQGQQIKSVSLMRI